MGYRDELAAAQQRITKLEGRIHERELRLLHEQAALIIRPRLGEDRATNLDSKHCYG